MPKKKLTQRFVETAQIETSQRKVDYFDTELTGLLLEVRKSGSTYYLRYQNQRGKTLQRKLANAAVLKLNDARRLAQEKLSQIALGEDPFEQKKALHDVPTLAQFITASYLPHVKGYKRSWETDECLLRNHVTPALGDYHLDELTRQHFVDLVSHHRLTHKPASTNRLLVLCRYVFNCALKWETAGLKRNPTHGIELLPANNKRERYLSQEETQHLFSHLEDSDNKLLKYIIALLLLSGARRNEALMAKWNDFDLPTRVWTVPINKTGKTRYIPISDGVEALLMQIPKEAGCDWLFPNPQTKKPFKSIFHSWDTARVRAGMPDVRIHDLRHSFASFLVNSGRSLYEVQKILGHTQVKTTQRYAHLSQDSLVAAANAASFVVAFDTAKPLIPATADLTPSLQHPTLSHQDANDTSDEDTDEATRTTG